MIFFLNFSIIFLVYESICTLVVFSECFFASCMKNLIVVILPLIFKKDIVC